MSSLTVLDATGDTKIVWNPDDESETAEARAMVEKLRGEGYAFFLVDGQPADEVAAGHGSLDARLMTSDEVQTLAAPDEPEPEAEATTSETRPNLRRRAGRPRKNTDVVAVRPQRGG